MKIKLPNKNNSNVTGILPPEVNPPTSSKNEDDGAKDGVIITPKSSAKDRNEALRYINGFMCLIIILGCSYSIWVFVMNDWKRDVIHGENDVEYSTLEYSDGRYRMSPIECPDYNKSISLNDANRKQQILSIEVEDEEDCGILCKNNPDCNFWHYYELKYCTPGNCKRCHTFSNCTFVDDFPNSDTVDNGIQNMVTGTRNCLIDPTKKAIKLPRDKTCSKASVYTRIDGTDCDGWMKMSLNECKEKCTKNEIPTTCPDSNRNCSFIIWDDNPDWPPGWCQLADSSCEINDYIPITETSKLANEFEEQQKMAEINTLNTSSFPVSSTSTVRTILTLESAEEFSSELCEFKQNYTFKRGLTFIGIIKPKERCAVYAKEFHTYSNKSKKYENTTGMVWLDNGRCYAHFGYDLISDGIADIWEYPFHFRSDVHSTWACAFPIPPQVLLILSKKAAVVVAKDIINNYDPEQSLITLDVHDGLIDVYDDHVFQQRLFDGLLESYDEGSSIELTCVVLGSYPSCNVSWWIDNKMVDDSFEDMSPKRTSNILEINKLSRKYANSEIKCIGSSSNTRMEEFQLISTIKLDLNLKPIDVELSYNGSALSEGKEYKFTCHVYGSRPPSIVTWWVDNMWLTENYKWHGGTSSRELGNGTTLSSLRYTPTIWQNGKKLECRADNSLIQNSTVVGEAILNVTLSDNLPRAKLSIWDPVEFIMEGNSITLICNVTASPDSTTIVWKKDGNQLEIRDIENDPNPDPVIHYYRWMRDDKIIFVTVSKQNEGSYVCEAINSVGTGSSNEVKWKIDKGGDFYVSNL